ncbi:MAG: lysophospholipid acyltransferase family protein [Hyphomicrobiales bacterium]|nr:lysophospholipid acyltransferase family protein [Hyphomicrobiales bacterium]MBV9518934.1 lysophospholipid acyltransferase family protein [Hyphomicrobiales bacterium]
MKQIGRSRPVLALLGFGLASYLRLLRRTTRFTLDPPDLYLDVDKDKPFIAALWHGQHFMLPFMIRDVDKCTCLISKHATAEINARAARHLGIGVLRGSGAGQGDPRRKGGARALREMLDALASGLIVGVTADIPKTARVVGPGIILLAKLSGRPIRPCAVVASRRIDFDTWDRASMGLPLGRGVIALGDAIRVAPDASPDEMEQARRALENGLDRLHERAYALMGSADPGAMGGDSL